MSKLNKDIVFKLKVDDKELEAKLENADQLIDGIAQSTQTATSRFSNMGNIITGINQGIELLQSAWTMLSKPINIAGEFEKYKVQFEVLLGSADAAEQRIDELAEFASKTPFEFPEIIRASKQLEVMTGGAIATGEGLKLLGDVSAGVGAPIDELSMWFGRLYDAIQSGRPMGEAMMRMQELGAISGEARGEIEDLQKSGADANEIWETFTGSMSRFNGMMEKQSQSYEGMVSNLQDATTLMLKSLGDTMLPVAKDILGVLIPAIDDIGESIDDIISILKVVAITTATWTLAIYGAEAALKAKAIALQIVDKFMKVFNTTMAMNPAVAIAASLVTLTAIVYELTDGFNVGTSALKDHISEQRKELQTRKEVLVETENQIKLLKEEAIKNGESAEKVAEFDTKLKDLLKTRKELNLLEKQIASQELASEYIDTLYGGFETFMSSSGVLKNMNNVFAEEALAAAQLLSGSIEDRLGYVDQFLQTATQEQKAVLTKYKTMLIEMSLLEEDSVKKTGEANKEKAKTVNDLQKEIKNLKDSLGELTESETGIALKIKQQITDKENLIKKILGEYDKKQVDKFVDDTFSHIEQKVNDDIKNLEFDDIVLPDLRLASTDEFSEMEISLIEDRRKREYELLKLWKERELDKYRDDAEMKLLIEKRFNQQKMDLLRAELRDSNLIYNSMQDGFSTMWDTIIIGNRQAKNEWDAVWLSMRNSALYSLGEMLAAELENIAIRTAAHIAGEEVKTAATAEGAAVRLAFLVEEIAKTLASAAASILKAIASLIAWQVATFGPFALATIPASIAAIMGIFSAVKGALGFEHGGRLQKGESGYFEGYHNEIIAPEKTFIDVFRNELRPQIYSGLNGNNSELLSEIKSLNRNMEKYTRNMESYAVSAKAFGYDEIDQLAHRIKVVTNRETYG